MKICTATQMRSIDRRTIEEFGIPGVVLMERAGLAVAMAILDRKAPPASALIVSGTGNNGGDGFVVARELSRRGIPVRVLLIGESSRVTGDALTNLKILKSLGIAVKEASGASVKLPVRDPQGIIVDALFGTGLDREVTGTHRAAIRAMNRSGIPIIAVDMPSGVCSDTGRILGEAVRAEETITFGLPKAGQFLYPGASHCGRLTVADIGFPEQAVAKEDIRLQTVLDEAVSSALPPRPADAHKGTFGHLLIVAGSKGKLGAAILAGHAALRSGCGLVTLAIPESFAPAVTQKLPEAMTLPLPAAKDGTISSDAASLIVKASHGMSAVAMGPGLSVNRDIMTLVRSVLLGVKKPVVIDADAVNALMGDAAFLDRIKHPIILTPHPAEFGRLIDTDTVDIQADRFGAVAAFIEKHRHVLVLKGARTVIGDPSTGDLHVNLTGNSGMATAGTGDVLTGVTGALLAAGMDRVSAAVSAVHIHGLAGDLAAREKSERSMTASDLVRALPEAFRLIRLARQD